MEPLPGEIARCTYWSCDYLTIARDVDASLAGWPAWRWVGMSPQWHWQPKLDLQCRKLGEEHRKKREMRCHEWTNS